MHFRFKLYALSLIVSVSFQLLMAAEVHLHLSLADSSVKGYQLPVTVKICLSADNVRCWQVKRKSTVFRNIPPGVYSLNASAPGYTTLYLSEIIINYKFQQEMKRIKEELGAKKR